MIKLEPGRQIAYSAKFLREIGAQTGELPRLCGEFLGTKKVGQREFCVVQWDDADETSLVQREAIAPTGPNTEFYA